MGTHLSDTLDTREVLYAVREAVAKEDDRLINKVLLDAFAPGSKQPEYKVCAVQISKAS